MWQAIQRSGKRLVVLPHIKASGNRWSEAHCVPFIITFHMKEKTSLEKRVIHNTQLKCSNKFPSAPHSVVALQTECIGIVFWCIASPSSGTKWPNKQTGGCYEWVDLPYGEETNTYSILKSKVRLNRQWSVWRTGQSVVCGCQSALIIHVAWHWGNNVRLYEAW